MNTNVDVTRLILPYFDENFRLNLHQSWGDERFLRTFPFFIKIPEFIPEFV